MGKVVTHLACQALFEGKWSREPWWAAPHLFLLIFPLCPSFFFFLSGTCQKQRAVWWLIQAHTHTDTHTTLPYSHCVCTPLLLVCQTCLRADFLSKAFPLCSCFPPFFIFPKPVRRKDFFYDLLSAAITHLDNVSRRGQWRVVYRSALAVVGLSQRGTLTLSLLRWALYGHDPGETENTPSTPPPAHHHLM